MSAQEETISALWAFAKAAGAEDHAKILAAAGPALERIVAAFGCEMTEIQ